MELRKLFGDRVGGEIDRVFRRMEIAEQEISNAKGRHPFHIHQIHGAFRYLHTTQPLQRKAEPVYRAHCRELLDRVPHGHDMQVPTSAEVLCTLLDMSLKAPLNTQALALAERLFAKVMQQLPSGSKFTPEPWKGSNDELFERLSRQLATAIKRGDI